MQKRILSGLVAFCALSVMAVPAQASRCYSPVEMQAEQLLRLHSELMVITVTCQRSSTGKSLVPAYTGFTKKNLPALHDAEQTLIRHYAKNYGGNGIPQLDRLRTRLGNEYGQEIADVSAPVFCGERRDKVVSYYKAGESQVWDQVEAMEVSEKSYEPLCSDEDTMRVARKGE